MIKLGFTSYSFSKAITAGTIDVLKAIELAASYGAEHMEFSPGAAYPFKGNPELVKKIKLAMKDNKLEFSSYTIGANFVQPTPEELRAEIDRVKSEVEIGAELGVPRMRHDCAWRPIPEAGYENFEHDFQVLVDACGEIADYAAKYGITTSIENHGFFVQGSERVKRIVLAVDRKNFGTTLDVGNFLCVDEEPVPAVMNNISIATMVHFKDFHRKKGTPPCTDGYLKTAHGNYIRGAITGDGDVDLARISEIIKESGYDGFLSIEYEGWDDCLKACPRAFKNVAALIRG